MFRHNSLLLLFLIASTTHNPEISPKDPFESNITIMNVHIHRVLLYKMWFHEKVETET